MSSTVARAGRAGEAPRYGAAVVRRLDPLQLGIEFGLAQEDHPFRGSRLRVENAIGNAILDGRLPLRPQSLVSYRCRVSVGRVAIALLQESTDLLLILDLHHRLICILRGNQQKRLLGIVPPTDDKHSHSHSPCTPNTTAPQSSWWQDAPLHRCEEQMSQASRSLRWERRHQVALSMTR